MDKLTIIEFANNYIPSTQKIKVVKNYETIFKGSYTELYCQRTSLLTSVIAMVGADEDGFLCLSLRLE